MKRPIRNLELVCTIAMAATWLACSSNGTSSNEPSKGGSTSAVNTSGGSSVPSSSGGASSGGVTASDGGSQASGGTSSQGGAQGSGGVTTSGGSRVSGGNTAVGGAQTSGGNTPSSGGVTGGTTTTPLGGTSSAGGRTATGGATGAAGGTTGTTPVGDGWKPGYGYTCPNIPKPTCNTANPTSYTKNSGNLGTHDPSVFADGNCNFYQVATHSIMPSKKSTDMYTWAGYSSPSFAMPAWSNNAEVWAADGTYANGKYWIYYSAWHGDIPSAQVGMIFNTTIDSSSPNYKWQDGGMIVDRTNGGNGGLSGKSNVNIIDPNLFIDDDGSWWLIYGSFNDGTRIIPLDNTTGKPKDNPVKPTVVTDHLGEGSSLIRYKDYYYVAVSRGKCCSGTTSSYEVIYARSSSVTGPYKTKSGGSFSTSSYTDATDALMPVGFEGDTGGQGGQHFFRVNGQWYIDYHAYRTDGTNLTVRPIYFDSSGWMTYDCTKAN